MTVHQWSPSNLTEHLQTRMAEDPPIQVCKACRVIPKLLQQSVKGSEYLSTCDISVFPSNTFSGISKILFSVCHYGALSV